MNSPIRHPIKWWREIHYIDRQFCAEAWGSSAIWALGCAFMYIGGVRNTGGLYVFTGVLGSMITFPLLAIQAQRRRAAETDSWTRECKAFTEWYLQHEGEDDGQYRGTTEDHRGTN